MGAITDLNRTLRFLWHVFRREPAAPNETAELSANGNTFEADIFFPTQSAPPYPTMLFCHGMTALGRRDPRIQRLAFGLSKVGYLVCIPHFPKAADLRIDPEMPSQLVDFFLEMLNWPKVAKNRRGFFGVSHGGTLSFLAANHAALRNQVDFIVSIGAYASLEKLIEYGFDHSRNEAHPFLREILLRNLQTKSETAPTALDLISQNRTFIERVTLSKLLLSSKTRVLLIHSESDNIIPVSQLATLESELKAAGIHAQSRRVNLSGHAQLRPLNFLGPLYYAARDLVAIGMRHD